MNYGLSSEDLRYITCTLSKFHMIEKAVLFGSRAKGDYKQGSDIDIAIYGKNVDMDTVSQLHALLEEESPLPYFFDVVDGTHLTHQGLHDHIHRVGKVIYCCNS